MNVTLLFAVQRYEEIANAWIEGLEERVAAGEPVDRLASVASFFVSRVDSKVDARLEQLGHSELQGIAAVANAKLAYRSHLDFDPDGAAGGHAGGLSAFDLA